MILAAFGAKAVFDPGLLGFGILFAFVLPTFWLLTRPA